MSRRDYEDEDDGPYVVIERSSGLGTFFLGLAIGAGVALLFAPRSGAETRQKLGQSARRVRTAASDAVGGVADTMSETFETARQRVEDRISAARDAIDEKRSQVRRAVRAGREAAHDAREELELTLAETKAAYKAGATVAKDAKDAKVAKERSASKHRGA